MNTRLKHLKTVSLICPLLCLGLFLTPHKGQCFYNPNSGKWLSRDPVEEGEGGPALYGFVANKPVTDVDYLGEFTIDPSAKTIGLAKCEIAILYGHGSGLRRNHWRWTFADAGCNAGAAVMCWPDTNMKDLPQEIRLWTQWDGESVSEGNWEKVSWRLPADGPLWDRAFWMKYPNGKRVLVNVLMSAVRRAWAICDGKACNCKNVAIRLVQINSRGEIVDPSRPDDGVPQMPRQITITCPSGVISCP